MSKQEDIYELYQSTLREITSSGERWLSFLTTVSHNSRYKFKDQVMIFAQRPEATACASIEVWNSKRFSRWVNRGTKSIVLFDECAGGEPKLKYVFDVLDTNSKDKEALPLWSVRKETEEEIVLALEKAFGGLDSKGDFASALHAASENTADEIRDKYLDDFQTAFDYSTAPSAWLVKNELAADDFIELVKDSISYCVQLRSGVDVSEYFTAAGFQNITNFSDAEVETVLGTMVSDASEILLREIGAAVKEIQAQEKKKNNRVKENNHGRSDVLTERGLFDTQHRIDTQASSAASREVRRSAPDVSTGDTTGTVSISDNVRGAEQTSGGHQRGSDEESGSHIEADTRSKSGAEQENGYDGLDSASKQRTGVRRRNRPQRDDLQLSLFTPVEEQIQLIEKAEQDKNSAFSVTQEDIDFVLCKRGTGFEHGKFRVGEIINRKLSDNDAGVLIKKEFGIGGGTIIWEDGTWGGENHASNGLSISKSGVGVIDYDIRLSWTQVAKRIRELIAADRYLSQKEKEQLSLAGDNTPAKIEDTVNVSVMSDAEHYPYDLAMRLIAVYNEYDQYGYDDTRDVSESKEEEIQRIVAELRDPAARQSVFADLREMSNTTDADLDQDWALNTQSLLAELEVCFSGKTLPAEQISPVVVDVGSSVYIGKKEYILVVYEQDKVTLKDADFPLLNRIMSVDLFFKEITTNPLNRNLLEALDLPFKDVTELQEETSSQPVAIGSGDSVVAAETPAIRSNYRIDNDDLGHGGAKSKFAANVSAIELMKKIEEVGRIASPAEQELLSRYVGWGGMPQAFDVNNAQWGKEYELLKGLLTDKEYVSARESTLSAYYTPPVVIRAIYQAIESMGFKRGNVLEPSMGVGNFFGMLPESMKDCKLYGVELDSVSGRIAQQLYQNANIEVGGFENTALPDSFFDLAIGNVPFGDFKLIDKRYDKQNFRIHDYFFAKTLDKVRPGGVVAFITSRGTMDKQNSSVRKYISQRAELLGAVRLPDNAFQANAGTEVTSDILFLKKRDRAIETDPEWINLDLTADRIPINSYFTAHPEMILGKMTREGNMYGNLESVTCKPFADKDLAEQLRDALSNVHAELAEDEPEITDADFEAADSTIIPADPTVRNFSFTVVDGKLYYRQNSQMILQVMSKKDQDRIKGMIEIRDSIRSLIECQTEDGSDADVAKEQATLGRLYDAFVKENKRISTQSNRLAFSGDSSYPMLCALENFDDEGEFLSKADIFTKRTIRRHIPVEHTDTSVEALSVSMSEKGKPDMSYMMQLTGKTKEEVETDLRGIIFRDPDNADSFLEASEYLSGNVRIKLAQARLLSAGDSLYNDHVKALEKVMPKPLSAADIDIRLGATWLPPSDVQDFMYDTFKPAWWMREDPLKPSYSDILVKYVAETSLWYIRGKAFDSKRKEMQTTHGTHRVDGYSILESTLNLKDVKVTDEIEDSEGKKKRVLNKKETVIAQQKQDKLKQSFADWIWKDADRRDRLTKIYNEKFNSVVPREYDGSHIQFSGMTPLINLKKHQVDAVARCLYGGNALLAHVVGAGKTYEMVAAAMENKRLGLSNKSLFVVPNHLTDQWGAAFLSLYPAANVLVATKKDFETLNRKKFCSRIATGEFDAVVIGHSQFERIPMSLASQKEMIQEQKQAILDGIAELKRIRGERSSIKKLESEKKKLDARLEKLNDTERKDDVITFEELGVDKLFVDEAHFYKNLFLYSKMQNVSGLSHTDAKKSADLFMKCRYLDKQTGGRGIVFATGTPVSNSMTELYTMQRYLQYETLRKNDLLHFDCWASTFGETVTAIELSPEGTGYRAKTRFARFYNLPELMNMFKEVADIRTADMLDLPVPKANFQTCVVKPSETQRAMVADLSERAERIRGGGVNSSVDNMLMITSDGRKIALDQRLMNDLLPDENESKINACANNVFRIWDTGKKEKLTQLVFCDLSVPNGGETFSVYTDLKAKLIEHGIPENEVVFMHSANTDKQKADLFAKVRQGNVRVLLGSTAKMGAGTNVQDRLVAIHDLDCPWRPSDLEQRAGRIVRQGNRNAEVDIFRYVTESTFDAYLYQIIENKQKFISQIFTSKTPVRSAEDIDESSLSYAEIKALATGNPYIKEKMDLDIQVSKLKLVKSNHLAEKYEIEDSIRTYLPLQIRSLEESISGYTSDIRVMEMNTLQGDDVFSSMTVNAWKCETKEEAGLAILKACQAVTTPNRPVNVGNYRGFALILSFESFSCAHTMTLRAPGGLSHSAILGTDTFGNLTRINNLLDALPGKLEQCNRVLEDTKTQLERAISALDMPFEQEAVLASKLVRLGELNALLNMDEKPRELIDDTNDIEDESRDAPEKEEEDRER